MHLSSKVESDGKNPSANGESTITSSMKCQFMGLSLQKMSRVGNNIVATMDTMISSKPNLLSNSELIELEPISRDDSFLTMIKEEKVKLASSKRCENTLTIQAYCALAEEEKEKARRVYNISAIVDVCNESEEILSKILFSSLNQADITASVVRHTLIEKKVIGKNDLLYRWDESCDESVVRKVSCFLKGCQIIGDGEILNRFNTSLRIYVLPILKTVGSPMFIRLRSFTGSSATIIVANDTKVGQIESLIKNRMVDAMKQNENYSIWRCHDNVVQLIYLGKRLIASKKLSDYCINNNSEIYLVSKFRSGNSIDFANTSDFAAIARDLQDSSLIIAEDLGSLNKHDAPLTL